MDEEVPPGVEEDAGDGDAVLDLVQQGLLPLSIKSILTARLVCKHWQKSIGCLITRLQLPYETWTAQPVSSGTTTAGPAAAFATAAPGAYLKGDYVTPDSLSDAEDDEDDGTAKQQDDDDIWIPPAAVMSYVSAAAAAATAAAVAAAKERAAATPGKRKQQQEQASKEHQEGSPAKQKRRKQQQQPDGQGVSQPCTVDAAAAAAAAAVPPDPAGHSSTAAPETHGNPELAAGSEGKVASAAVPSMGAGGAATEVVAAMSDVQHEGLVGPAEKPAANGVAGPATAAGAIKHKQQHHGEEEQEVREQQLRGTDVLHAPEGELHNSHRPHMSGTVTLVTLQSTAGASQPSNGADQQQQQPDHPLQQLPSSFPFCTEVTLQCRNRSSPYAAPQQGTLIIQSLSILSQLPKLKTLTLQGSLPPGMWQQLVTGMQQQQQLQQRLVCLRLIGIDLPQPDVLEGVAELAGLKELVLHASIKSHALQPSHLEALACGTQLESLSLLVYQASGVNLRLNPLMQLTGLKSLEVAYKGIFKDQRPTLSPLASISNLSNLTALCASGLASPLLPQPNMTALVNLSATGLTKRVSEAALKTLSQCSSLRQVKFEAGRRGIAAVAADQLQHLGMMKQLTCVSLSLSKGGLKAGASTQQLMQLSALTGLKGLTLSADHRLGFSTEQLQALAAQWPKLESLRCNSFSPLQGLAGFGAFRGLVALSLKPGTGVGKLLFELKEALEPLENLQRLHLDFRGGLRLDHVEAVAEACSTRLQHLSLNMRASSIGSKAIVDIAQLQCLTSLQLLNTTAATLAGPPAAVAIRSMKGLKRLSVQAAELAAQQSPSELGHDIAEGVIGLQGLQELKLWLGFGVEGRQAEVQLQRRLEWQLPCCRVHVLPEPEKPML